MFAIVAIGFNRVSSMHRLLSSLSCADYENDQVDLIISIDNSGSNDVENLSHRFEWEFGEKIIKTFPTRLGLRKHVLACGEYLQNYDAIAVFEDDIFVSPAFYNFMKKAVYFYNTDDNIAGISLYSPHWSEYNARPFMPMKNEYDVYFMQYAQSWGQIWMKKQWHAFRKWYDNIGEKEITSPGLPPNVSNWPATSWLKYHINYCIEHNKYFVYPHVSLSTNFTDIGHHNNASTTTYQVPINYGNSSNYKFVTYERNEDRVIYDAYFERVCIGKTIGVEDSLLCIDLYGGKDPLLYKKYLLTMKRHDYKVIKSYALSLRPHEMNILKDIRGDEIYLYDTTVPANKMVKTDIDIAIWHYDVKTIKYSVISKLLYSKILSKLTPLEIILSCLHRYRKYTRFLKLLLKGK